MFKFAIHALMPAVVVLAGVAEARPRQVDTSDSPAELYVKCTTVGSKDYDGHQCTTFRAAAHEEISACMSQGATNSQGYRALRLKCVELQVLRFTDPDA
ncbi:MAG: hypothetical protein ACK47C_05815 [Paracoccaceae bacterium]|jgi:hypothetical protein